MSPDAVPLDDVRLTGGADIRQWPITTLITRLITSGGGLEADFSKKASGWPDVIPPGWDGPIYYTVWLGAMLPDGLHLAASLVSYRGQPGAGAGDVTNISQYSANLWYLDPALKGHTVTEGETLYLLVTAGGYRGLSVTTVQERSNLVAFTASSTARTFTYDDPPPPPPPPPPSDVVQQLALLTRGLDSLDLAFHEAMRTFDTTVNALQQRIAALEGQHIPTGCTASATLWGVRVPVACKLTYDKDTV